VVGLGWHGTAQHTVHGDMHFFCSWLCCHLLGLVVTHHLSPKLAQNIPELFTLIFSKSLHFL
jgi:hypothetical protein